MAGDRQIRINLDGKETVSPAAKKAGAALENLGDKAEEAARDADKLDGEIEDLSRSLVGLAAAYAAAGSAEERADLGKSIRKLQSQTRQLSGVRKLLRGAGEDGATEFSIGFVGRVGPLLARAPLSPPIAGAIAVGAPIIASAVAAAVTAGVGLAAVGGGLAIAFRDPSVKAAGKELGDEIGQTLTRAAQPFVPATLRAIDIVRKEFRTMEPELDRIFGASAPWVPRLAEAGAKGGHEFARGFADAVENADPAIRVLEYHIPRAAGTAGNALSTLSKNAEYNSNVLSAALTSVEFSVEHLANSINLLSEVSKVSLVGALIDATSGFRGTEKVLKDIPASTSTASSEFARLGTTVTVAATAARTYADASRMVADQNLSAAEATLRYKDAVNAAKDSVDKKRKVSQDEDRALINLARSSNTLIESLDHQGASAGALSAKHGQLRNDFIKAAVAAGYSEQKAATLADQYLAMPRNVNTTITAETEQAARNLRMVRDLIAAIKSKRVVITTVNNTVVTRSEGRNVGIGDGVGGREYGGPVRKGHAYVVGEKRPEVFVPDRDGTVIPSIDKYNQMTGRVPSPTGSASGVDAEKLALAIGRAMARELRNLPIYRVPDAGRQANVWRRTS